MSLPLFAGNDMKIVRYILRSINVLNIILIAVAALLAARFVFPYLNYEIKYKPPVQKQKSADNKSVSLDNRTISPLDYTVIAEQNIFHPERQIPVEKKDEKPLSKPEFVLYGILMTDETMIAYMEDKKSPSNTPGRGKRQLSLKKGDMLSGFRLESIEENRVIMSRGEEKLTVYISDKQKQRTRDTGLPAAQQKQPSLPVKQPLQPN